MSMVTQIVGAIKTAKLNLGDLLRDCTLRKVTGKSYVSGTYTPTTSDTPVQLVVDRFTVEERMAEGFQETDLKVSVFNDDANAVNVDMTDKILLDGVWYNVISSTPAYVGPVKVLFEVKLRR